MRTFTLLPDMVAAPLALVTELDDVPEEVLTSTYLASTKPVPEEVLMRYQSPCLPVTLTLSPSPSLYSALDEVEALLRTFTPLPDIVPLASMPVRLEEVLSEPEEPDELESVTYLAST